MVATNYKIAYSEVLEILKHISEDEFNKIPNDMIELFKANASNENEFVYNPNKTLEEQNVSETARTIIAILFRDYWATENQRNKIVAKQNYDRNKLEEKKQEKYNTDNIFKNRQNISSDFNNTEIKSTALIEFKEKNFLQKIFDKIKNLFNRKK